MPSQKSAHKLAVSYADSIEPRAQFYEKPPNCYEKQAAVICKNWIELYSAEKKRLLNGENRK